MSEKRIYFGILKGMLAMLAMFVALFAAIIFTPMDIFELMMKIVVGIVATICTIFMWVWAGYEIADIMGWLKR